MPIMEQLFKAVLAKVNGQKCVRIVMVSNVAQTTKAAHYIFAFNDLFDKITISIFFHVSDPRLVYLIQFKCVTGPQ